MIRYAPELAPVPRETREVVRLFFQSLSIGASSVVLNLQAPITKVVRMPRYLQVGMTADDGSWVEHGLPGKRVLSGKRGVGKSLREKPTGPADVAREAFDGIAARLRQVLAGARRIARAIEAVPEGEREAWQAEALQGVRAVVAQLERAAFEGCDGLRGMVPGEE